MDFVIPVAAGEFLGQMFILPAELNRQEERTLVPPKLRALGLQVSQIIEIDMFFIPSEL